MRLVDLMQKANAGYPDGFLVNFYDEETGKPLERESLLREGDGLALFIVRELAETFEADASDEDQLSEAIRVMDQAASDIQHVLHALEN